MLFNILPSQPLSSSSGFKICFAALCSNLVQTHHIAALQHPKRRGLLPRKTTAWLFVCNPAALEHQGKSETSLPKEQQAQ